jgi:hypothetical protein
VRRGALQIVMPSILAMAIAGPVAAFQRAPVQPPGRTVPDAAPARTYSAKLSGPKAGISNTLVDMTTSGTPPVFRVVVDPEGARRLPTLIDPAKYQPNDHLIPVESCDRVPVQLSVVVTLGAGSPYNKHAMPSYFLYATVGNQKVDGGSMPFAEPGVAQWLPMREPLMLGPGLHTVTFRLQWNLPAQGLPLPEVGLRSQFEIRCRQEPPSRQIEPAVNPIGVIIGNAQPNSGIGNVPPTGVSPTAGSAAPARAGAAPNWGAVPGGVATAPVMAPAAATPPRDALPAQRGAGRLSFASARLGTIAYEQLDLQPAQSRLRAARRADREVTLLQQMAAQGTVEPVVRVAFADSEYELSQVLVSAVRLNQGAGAEPPRYAIDLQFAGIRRLR